MWHSSPYNVGIIWFCTPLLSIHFWFIEGWWQQRSYSGVQARNDSFEFIIREMMKMRE